MRIITRTVYGSALQTSHLLNRVHEVLPHTTLNEKFQVQTNVLPTSEQAPALKYFALGIGGHENRTGADGFPYTSPLNHLATDAACFQHVPFVLRQLDNDLNTIERAKYAMRVIETHDGIEYAAYYLKRLELDNVAAKVYHTAVVNGVETTTQYVPDSSCLSPRPPELTSDNQIITSGDYISTTAMVPIQFTQHDVDEYLRAIRVIYDNDNYAVVSEIALVSGVDKLCTGAAHSGTVDYLEAIAAQVATFITCHYSIGFSNQGFTFEIELGASEPLLGILDASGATVV